VVVDSGRSFYESNRAMGAERHCVYFTISGVTEEKMTVETPLFDKPTMLAYAKKNTGEHLTDEEAGLLTEYRGGSQGDYSMGMEFKLSNVVDCLTRHPESKRAVIMINNRRWFHYDTDEAKCLRELHFYLTPTFLEDAPGRIGYLLNCVALFRAQAVDILPKNLYFAYYVMNKVKERLKENLEPNIELGDYSQFVTNLVATRED